MIVAAVGVAMATSVIPADAAVSRKAPTPTQVVNASFEALNRGDAVASAADFAPNGKLITHWAGVIRVPGAP